MARKPLPPAIPAKKASPVAAPAAAPVSTGVRNSPIPRGTGATPSASSQTPRALSHEMIARRAYEISRSGSGGSEIDNWLRAERELRAQGR